MSRYFDRKGQPMELMEWARVHEADNRVSVDTIEGQRVSTVWLGLDHRFDEGPPLIFETMIFGGPHDQYCDEDGNYHSDNPNKTTDMYKCTRGHIWSETR